MKTNGGLVRRTALALAIWCTGLFVYNMAAIVIYQEQVFLERGTMRTGQEMFIFIGFLLAPIFNIASLLWVLARIRRARTKRKGDKGILVLGAFCMVLLVGDKVMVDEIGREYLLGWEDASEWIILYVFLSIQLLYNLLIMRDVYRSCMECKCEAQA